MFAIASQICPDPHEPMRIDDSCEATSSFRELGDPVVLPLATGLVAIATRLEAIATRVG